MSSVSVGSPQRSPGDYDHVGTGGAGETWYIANQVNALALPSNAFGANIVVAMPFVAPARGGALDRIAYEITISAGGNGRIGVYDSVGGTTLYPGNLLVDSGNIANAVAFQSFTVAIPLAAGRLYWLAHNQSIGGVTDRGLAVGGCSNLLGVQTGGGITAIRNGLQLALAFGALPNPYTAGATYLTGPPPALFMRFSA